MFRSHGESAPCSSFVLILLSTWDIRPSQITSVFRSGRGSAMQLPEMVEEDELDGV